MTIDKVIKKTEKILAENYITEPPADIYELARLNGVEIIEKVFPPEYSHVSGFVSKDHGIRKMYVNLSDSQRRRKFTIAHELAHLIIHKEELRKNPNRSILFRIAIGELNKDPLEKKANIFAANLLVPLTMLKKYKDHKNIHELADFFGVSQDLIGYRLDLLKKYPDDVHHDSESPIT